MIELVFGGRETGSEGGRCISWCLVLAYSSSKCPLVMGLTSSCSTFSLGIENPFIYPSSFAIVLLERASPAVSVCDPVKIFFTSRLSYALFCERTHKTETGTLYRRRTSDSKPPGRVIIIDQSKELSSNLFFCGCTALLRPLPTTAKTFFWAKPAYIGFSSSNFTVENHIPSTAGDAVPATKTKTNSTLQLQPFPVGGIRRRVCVCVPLNQNQRSTC